jgi:molybdopterin converting factor small subunit
MKVRIPASLSQRGTSGMVDLDIPPAATLRVVLAEIEKQIPGATARIVDGDGRMRGYVNLYVNGDDVRHGAGMDTAVAESDEVLILPAISGG